MGVLEIEEKFLGSGVNRKKDGYIVSHYRKVGDKRPTLKIKKLSNTESENR